MVVKGDGSGIVVLLLLLLHGRCILRSCHVAWFQMGWYIGCLWIKEGDRSIHTIGRVEGVKARERVRERRI